MNKKEEEGLIILSLLDLDVHILLPLDIGAPGSQTFEFWDLYQWSFWCSGLWPWFKLYHQLCWFSGLQVVNSGSSQLP